MNAKKIITVSVMCLLPAATGCGTARNLLFGRGAACGGTCAATGPAYNVAPPAYGGPMGPGPAMGGCGGPACGAPQGGEYGCGGEFGGAYYGGYDGEYPETVIGNPTVGNGISGGPMIDGYNSDNWMPADSYVVPGSQRISEPLPVAPMLPVPQGR